MKELKPYLRRSLHFLSIEFFLWTNAGNTDKCTSQQQFTIFRAELSKMKRSVELLSRETRRIDFKTASSLAVCLFEWFSKQPTSTFPHPFFAMRKLKIFHAGSTEIIFRISTNCSCWDLWQIPLQIVLETLFIFNMIYADWICFETRGSLFFLSCSRHQKRSPLNSRDRKFVLTEESMTPVPYNKLLTNLVSSIRTGEYWPSVVFVRTSLRSVRTSTTSGQYSPVQPSCSVSKRLLLYG